MPTGKKLKIVSSLPLMQAHLSLFEAKGGSWEWGSHRTWLLLISAWSPQIGQTHCQTGSAIFTKYGYLW